MKRFLIWLCCLFVLVANVGFSQQSPEMAPDFSAKTTSGKLISLSQFRGQVVLLDFWASWCKPCQQEFPFLVDLYREHRDTNFVVLAVNVDEHAENMEKFLSGIKWIHDFPVLPDPKGEIPALYHIDRMPTTILIAPNGEVRYRHGGFDKSHKERLLQEVKTLLANNSS